jgi:hypothetical protein
MYVWRKTTKYKKKKGSERRRDKQEDYRYLKSARVDVLWWWRWKVLRIDTEIGGRYKTSWAVDLSDTRPAIAMIIFQDANAFVHKYRSSIDILTTVAALTWKRMANRHTHSFEWTNPVMIILRSVLTTRFSASLRWHIGLSTYPALNSEVTEHQYSKEICFLASRSSIVFLSIRTKWMLQKHCPSPVESHWGPCFG